MWKPSRRPAREWTNKAGTPCSGLLPGDQKEWSTHELTPWRDWTLRREKEASHKDHRVSELISLYEISRRDKSVGTECRLVVAQVGWKRRVTCTRESLWGEGRVLKPDCTSLDLLKVIEFDTSNRRILWCINDTNELIGDCLTGQGGESLSSWLWSRSWSRSGKSEQSSRKSYWCPKFSQSSNLYQYSQKCFWSLILKIRVK